ncbi:unnamed protein product [Schistosoma mattheei]|uniref:Uncharacterized protein n=1 Tax=Schistosoma mattheei TaxID=31246 RepID=A0A183NN76_9TREM|nr:unnamed protein product [Schistosoma mattheei]
MINLGHSVTGVEVIRFPIGSPNVLVGEPQRCVVFATTPCRMYQFAGWINTNSSTTGSILSHLAANTATSGISNAINAYTGGHRSSLVNEYNQQQSVGIQNTTIFPIITGLFSSVFNSDDKLPVGKLFFRTAVVLSFSLFDTYCLETKLEFCTCLFRNNICCILVVRFTVWNHHNFCELESLFLVST